MYRLIPSREQQLITQASKDYNIMVNAVAGSGKTTTVINIGKSLVPPQRALLITYSARLKEECRMKVRIEKLTQQLEVHSFHSLYHTYYGMCTNDDQLQGLIRSKTPIRRVDNYQIIIIDEIQDMTKYLFLAVKKFLINTQFSGRLIVMGDVYQNIFGFKGSDSRFLTCANDIFKRSFINLRLTTSFRLTPPMAYFVNEVVLGQPWMTSGKRIIAQPKPGMSSSGYPKVSYYRGSSFQVYKRVGNIMAKAILNGKWKIDDIFVLAQTVKHPGMRDIANILTKNKIMIYYNNTDDGVLDEKYLTNKVALINFHKCKGLERPIVIVCGFDAGYFQYFGQDLNPKICPEVLYVAATRANYRLVVINGYDEDNVGSDILPFLNLDKLHNSEFIEVNNCDMKYPIRANSIDWNEVYREPRKTCVTQLVKHLTVECGNILRDLIRPILTRQVYNDGIELTMPLDVTRYHDGKKLVEYVGHINAVAITLKHQVDSANRIEDTAEIRSSPPTTMLVNHNQPIIGMLVAQYLEEATRLIATTDRVGYYLDQIPPYDWLEEYHLQIGSQRLNKFLDSVGIDKFMIEVEVGGDKTCEWIRRWNNQISDVAVTGYIDILHCAGAGSVNIVEVKCVQEVTLEHVLQLLIYGWLWSIDPARNSLKIEGLYLYSIITNEMITVKFNVEVIRMVANILLTAKHNPVVAKTYDQFIQSISVY